MIAAVVIVFVVALVVAVVVAVAIEPGPTPADVAVAYEEAWGRLDFEALWTLSGEELRGGLDHRAFLAARSEDHGHESGRGHLVRGVVVEGLRSSRLLAVADIRVDLRDGEVTRKEVEMARRAGRWVVVGYRFRLDSQDARAG